MHVSLPELLDHFGWPHDDEHKRMVEKSVQEMMVELNPTTIIRRVDKCPNCGANGQEPHSVLCPLY